MENLNSYLLPLLLHAWIEYIFWILIFSGVIIASIIGLSRSKNKGFIFIFISSILCILNHLPSIYFKGFYAMRRLTPAEYGELYQKLSYADSIIFPLLAILSLIGLFFIALKKN
jgi:hypothetical protein